ncbi:MAG: hypothetical protein K0R51_322 [Cytophagaceae bacterium]|jgi:hypothetical protein|nr:hypothetical protein [Cytophagaceae bacterium]
MNKILIAFFSLLLTLSCAAPIQTFRIASEGKKGTLKLYADSSFKEKINGESYSGRWSGSMSEDSTLNLVRTSHGSQILTLTPTITYKIKEGKVAIPKINYLFP